MSEMAANQHHEDVTKESVRDAILTFLDQWTRAACEDCSPTVLDDAFDGLDLDEIGPAMRRVGIELAMAGEWACQETAPVAEVS